MKYFKLFLWLAVITIVLYAIFLWKNYPEEKIEDLTPIQNPIEEISKARDNIPTTNNSNPNTSPLNSSQTSKSDSPSCLPSYLTLDTVIYTINNHPTTVEQKINELGAKCDNDKILVDSTGREIKFFKLTGCWGIPPNEEMRKELEEQEVQLEALKGKYTVIEISCNPSGKPTP